MDPSTMHSRSPPGAPRKRSNSLPPFGETPTPRKEENKNSVVSPFTLSAHKRKEPKESKARLNFMKSARVEDEDGDDSEGSGADQQSQQTDDTVDESFFDLLKTFAGLDLPDENAIEQCPLCPLTMPLAKFAEHVYECIKQLDPEEKKEQLRLDEQLAQQLSGQIDESDFKPSSVHSSVQAQEQGTPCAQGSACRKYDQGHHRWFSHPLVACPICTEEFTVFAIDAHVSLCLEMGNSVSAATYFGSTLSDPSDTSMGVQGFTPSSSLFASSSSSAPFQGDAFSALRGDGRNKAKDKNKSRKKIIEEEDEGDDADEDDGDEDEDELPPLIAPSPLVVHMAPQSMRGALSRSQMKAMAQAVIDQKAKPASKQDVSLVSMLETFRGLGFTKESLSQEINKDKAAAATPTAASTSFPSVAFHTSFPSSSTPDAFAPFSSTFPNQNPPTTTTSPISDSYSMSAPSPVASPFPTPSFFPDGFSTSSSTFSTTSTSDL